MNCLFIQHYEFFHSAHANNLMVNKFDKFTKLDTTKYACDGFIVDRFDMSQLIYDIAWCKYFEFAPAEFDTWSNEKILTTFYTNALYRTKLTHEYFSSEFDIKYVLFKKSEIVEYAVKKDTDRRIDNYDTNEYYQKIVSDLFDIFSKKTFDYRSVYNYIFTKWVIIDDYASVFKADDIICKVDTDEIYNDLLLTDSVPVQRCSQDGLDKLLERKDEVTSIIDDNIVQSIINYLKEKENINER